jgi:hypothetical protein
MFLNLKHATLRNLILIFLNIMVKCNENNKIEKKLFFFNVYHGGLGAFTIRVHNKNLSS